MDIKLSSKWRFQMVGVIGILTDCELLTLKIRNCKSLFCITLLFFFFFLLTHQLLVMIQYDNVVAVGVKLATKLKNILFVVFKFCLSDLCRTLILKFENEKRWNGRKIIFVYNCAIVHDLHVLAWSSGGKWLKTVLKSASAVPIFTIVSWSQDPVLVIIFVNTCQPERWRRRACLTSDNALACMVVVPFSTS